MSKVEKVKEKMDLQNDHNVYILGAGFSREAGLPLISDFLVKMRDSHEWLEAQGRNDEAKAVQSVLEFRLKAASAAYYVNLDLENIEELFSLASAIEGDMDRSIRVAIAATLDFIRNTRRLGNYKFEVKYSDESAQLFVAPTKKGGPAKFPTWAKPVGELNYTNPGRAGIFKMTNYAFHVARLLGLFSNGAPKGKNTFITFNYDTLLEDSLSELAIPYDYTFCSSKEWTSASTASKESAIPVLKLHGSVNWGRKHIPGQIQSPLKIYKTWSEMKGDRAEYVLVPPTWKKILGGPLEAIWDRAVSNLSCATRIIILGFSIPPTDMHFKYLLAAGLQRNVSLRQILFVNPDKTNQLKSRAEALLRNSYIASGLIGFSELDLQNFTLPYRHNKMNQVFIDDIGRPTADGTSLEFYGSD